MRKLDKPSISATSLPEIFAALDREVGRLGHVRKMKGNRRRAEPSYLMNWVALCYLEQTEAVRDAIARRGKELLDRHLASDEEIEVIVGGPSGLDAPAQGLTGKSWKESVEPDRKPDGDDSAPQPDARPAKKTRSRAK